MKQLVYCDNCGMVKVNIGEVQTQPGDMCGVFVEQGNLPEEASYCGGTLKLLED